MKRVHFMGIGGSGMNAVAGIAEAMGYEVSGCDFAAQSSDYIEALEKKGVKIFGEHNAAHLENIDILCVTPAVFDQSENHPEFVQAKERGIPVMTWQQFVGMELQSHKKVIAVAGTKGKSTTTALIGLILEKAGFDPTVLVGAKVKEWGANYRFGRGEWFVCEADEHFASFLHYTAKIAVITNIEMDHPEYFASMNEYMDVYVQFVAQMQKRGLLVLGDIGEIFPKIEEALGEREIAIERIENHLGVLHLNAPQTLLGHHNALNIAAASAVANHLEIAGDVVKQVVENFQGLGRRFELICEKNGVKIVNDYAHNPMSVRAVLDGARERFPDSRIWAVFQPHMYTRTKMFLKEFAAGFGAADRIVITPIFASREAGKPVATEISSQDLVAEIQTLWPEKEVISVDSLDAAAASILPELRPGDLLINMGAGDNGIISERLCERLG